MRLPFQDRRTLSGNEALNLAVIRVLGAVALILAVGAITLAWNNRPSPEWMGNVVNVLVGGLIGYLAKDIKGQPHGPTVDAPGAGTVNVDTGGTTEPPAAEMPLPLSDVDVSPGGHPGERRG